MSFELDVAKFAAKTKRNVETVIRSVSIKLFSAVILSSPVDTGRFRMNWQTAGSVEASGTINGEDKSGSKAIADMTAYVTSARDWAAFSLANNLPYAERLEYGYSKQAPQGMVRLNVRRFNKLLADEAKKVI